ncbi:MAG: riboflavin biosynthesis protein RibF [Chloroflexi bacterium]|nr:riboflavin biosynthesis protein RibF [Chloroflexota bacterium]
MAVVQGVDVLGAEHGPLFLVVGVFDGLHLGHAYLLDRLVAEARGRSSRPAVITFDHHPDEILTGAAPPLLCDPAERLERLEAAGVEVTVVQHFDQALRMTPFDTFVRRIAARAPVAGFLMTPDAAFGHERRGTPDAVARLGESMNFDVVVVPALVLDRQPVRSAEIRSAIAGGEVDVAARLLGRPYAVVGEGTAESGGVTRLTFRMPVALPPAGLHAAIVTLGDGAEVRGDVRVDDDGSIRVWVTPDASSKVSRLRVTFV